MDTWRAGIAISGAVALAGRAGANRRPESKDAVMTENKRRRLRAAAGIGAVVSKGFLQERAA